MTAPRVLCPFCTSLDDKKETALEPLELERGLYSCPECALLFAGPGAEVES